MVKSVTAWRPVIKRATKDQTVRRLATAEATRTTFAHELRERGGVPFRPSAEAVRAIRTGYNRS